MAFASAGKFRLEFRIGNEKQHMRIEKILEALKGLVELFRGEGATVKVKGFGNMAYPEDLMPFYEMGRGEWREVVEAYKDQQRNPWEGFS